MIEEEDLLTIEYLRNLSKMSTKDVKVLQDIMIKYIDKNTHICGHCGGQVRFAHRRFLIWYSDYLDKQKNIKDG